MEQVLILYFPILFITVQLKGIEMDYNDLTCGIITVSIPPRSLNWAQAGLSLFGNKTGLMQCYKGGHYWWGLWSSRHVVHDA